MPKVTPLLVIAGPTAAGKTEAAMAAARAVGGEIISADSMQIYRELDVGTAKPTPEQRAGVRFHLVDFVEPDEPYTVADFQRDADRHAVEAWERGRLPILCGGTGLYIRAVLERFVFPAAEPVEDAGVRRQLEAEAAQMGSEEMHGRLRRVDPVAAARIEPGDARRIVRALEVFELTGRPMSAQRRVDDHPSVKYNSRTFVLTRPRPQLFADINARVDDMLASGWLDEVRGLSARGHGPDCQGLQAIGYRHLLRFVRGECEDLDSLADVVEVIKRDTRRYAKRQLTWFRREAGAVWVEWTDRSSFEGAVSEMCTAGEGLVAEAQGV